MEEVIKDESIARTCWNKFKKSAVLVMYTPYVVCLASGKSTADAFRHCTSQDAYLLEAFVDACEKAEEYWFDDEEKADIRKMRNSMVRALELSNDDRGDSICSSTTKYTDFLLSTAAGKIGDKFPGVYATPFQKSKIAAYLVGIVAAYMRFYVFLSNELHALTDADIDFICKNWIDNYCSKNFEASTLQTEGLLDKLSSILTTEELKDLENVYHQATELEVEFFSSQPVLQQTVVPLFPVRDHAKHQLTVFCDFDMVCSSLDSSALLAELAIVTAEKIAQNLSETQHDLNASQTQPDLSAFQAQPGLNASHAQLHLMSSVDLRSKWQILSYMYTEELEKSMQDIVTGEKAKILNYAGLCEALEKHSGFEKRANSRVVKSGALKGLKLEDIKQTGLDLKLQDGCGSFFQKILKQADLKADAHILSYSWCSDLIRSALTSGEVDVMIIHSNDLAFVNSISTGEIIWHLQSPAEKLQVFHNSLTWSREDDLERLTVYIGGSVGDLLCLLEADIGIVMGTSPTLRRFANHFGVSLVPLFTDLAKKQRQLAEGGSPKWQGLSGILYTVSSWDEILAFFLGL